MSSQRAYDPFRADYHIGLLSGMTDREAERFLRGVGDASVLQDIEGRLGLSSEINGDRPATILTALRSRRDNTGRV